MSEQTTKIELDDDDLEGVAGGVSVPKSLSSSKEQAKADVRTIAISILYASLNGCSCDYRHKWARSLEKNTFYDVKCYYCGLVSEKAGP